MPIFAVFHIKTKFVVGEKKKSFVGVCKGVRVMGVGQG
jgi:hypothetical protein